MLFSQILKRIVINNTIIVIVVENTLILKNGYLKIHIPVYSTSLD